VTVWLHWLPVYIKDTSVHSYVNFFVMLLKVEKLGYSYIIPIYPMAIMTEL